MKLNNLLNANKYRKVKKRLGRGVGSGVGKTCGRGQKGQKSRSGVSINAYEGGQNPLYMRLPKRGFYNFSNKKMFNINLGLIQNAVDKGILDSSKIIDLAYLKELGLVKGKIKNIKILTGGKDLRVPLNIRVNKISHSAKRSIEMLNGVLDIIK